jgi:hypothetical protein
VGTAVTIYGDNFGSSGTVKFNGQTASSQHNTSQTPSTSAGLGLVAVGEGACLILEPCGTGEGAGLAAFGLVFAGSQVAIASYQYFSKGGQEQRQIRDVAREKGVDARKLGDAVEQAKKQEGRGGADNLSLDEIRQIADEMKAGGWWGNK